MFISRLCGFPLVCFLPFVLYRHSLSFWLVLTFYSPNHLYPFPLFFHPSCLSPLPPSPHPDRRSNSLSTAASKWFHPPSPLSSPANDVPRSIILWCRLPQSAAVCVGSRGGGITCEQFRGSKNRGKKKKKKDEDELMHKRPFFMCCQHAFPWSVRCLFETPPV